MPVFTSGAWQDEQTGGHFPDLWTRFTGAPIVKYTAYNGAHADGFTPQVLAEWKSFLDFYVTGELRPVDDQIRFLAPLLFREIFGAAVQLPAERFAGIYDDFDQALADYEAEPPVRILMESGGAPTGARGAPVAGFELAFDSWPPPETEPLRLYLHEDGTLRDFTPSESSSASSFAHDDAKGDETYVVNDSFEKALPDIEWLPAVPGRQVVFATEPFVDDVVMVGHASADLWIQSNAPDADLEVMLSEVRPDGNETYIASGWLRASRRALSPESTPLKPGADAPRGRRRRRCRPASGRRCGSRSIRSRTPSAPARDCAVAIATPGRQQGALEVRRAPARRGHPARDCALGGACVEPAAAGDPRCRDSDSSARLSEPALAAVPRVGAGEQRALSRSRTARTAKSGRSRPPFEAAGASDPAFPGR